MRPLKLVISLVATACFLFYMSSSVPAETKTILVTDSSDFVVLADVIPDLQQEIRYYSAYNFVGTRIDGYEEPVALMTQEAATALKNAAADFRAAGYVIKVYDAYRPQRAVNHFMRWVQDPNATSMKAYFYPLLGKDKLLHEYIATKSGHSRGSAIDMTVVNMKTGLILDTGEHFDYFGVRSHHDFTGVTPQQQANRAFIKKIMEKNGFNSLLEEWWHYSLKDEPFPHTYFDFPVTYLHHAQARN
jgi:D-alanyl-D-alanine dipeptidase